MTLRHFRFILLVLLFTPATMLHAQHSATENAIIQNIRQAYTAAVKNAAKIEKDKVTMTKNGCWGAENSRTVIDFYYTWEQVEGIDLAFEKLNLVRETQKGKTITYYQEFLFDPETEDLLFNLLVSDVHSEPVKVERRTYFGAADDGTAIVLVKVTDKRTGKDVTSQYSESVGILMDEGFMMRYGHNLVGAFSNLMLRGWD